MCKTQDKLFDFNRSGTLIDNETIIDSKVAREFVVSLQKHKAMGENWKLDIFINDSVESVCTGAISRSAAYEKGKFEYGIFLNKYWSKGNPNLESKDTTLFASFLTLEDAKKAVPQIISFIKYRYNMSLKIDETFKKGCWNRI